MRRFYLKNSLLTFLFNNLLNENDFEKIIVKIDKKIELSEINERKKGFLFEQIRIIKYLVPSLMPRNKPSEKIHISLPYFKHDIIKETNLQSISDFKLSLVQSILIFLKSIIFLIYLKFFKKGIKPIIFSSLFVGYIYYNRLKFKKLTEIHFYGYSFILDVNFLSFFLTKDPLREMHFHENTNFINDSLIIEADYIYYISEISCNYSKQKKEKYLANSYFYKISNKDIKEKITENFPKKQAIKTIGLYSEGFYKRGFETIKQDIILECRSIEKKLSSFLFTFALKNPEITFTIFPHYSRGLESTSSSKNFYQDLLSLKNVKLNPSSKESSDTFSEINLGLVVRSEIFWDRIFLGLPTILISPIIDSEFIEQTPLKRNTFYIEDNDFEENIDKYVKNGIDSNFIKF